MKRIKLFIEVCLVTGLSILIFSAIASKITKPNGIFIGAIIGGIVGIILAARIAIHFKIVEKYSFKSILIFSILGFTFAALISIYNLHSPIIVVLSTNLIGFGALIGDYLNSKISNKLKSNNLGKKQSN